MKLFIHKIKHNLPYILFLTLVILGDSRVQAEIIVTPDSVTANISARSDFKIEQIIDGKLFNTQNGFVVDGPIREGT